MRATYAKWAKVDSGINLNAFDFARRLLDRQGLTDVRIEPTPGQLTDHYDPRGKVLRVSTQVADPTALTSGAVAAASPGCRSRPPPSSPTRSATPSRTTTGSRRCACARPSCRPPSSARASRHGSSSPASGSSSPGLAIVGLIGFAAAVLFTFATLPVEIGASGKALAFVNTLGLSGERQDGARDVLKAAAWTYVAGALTALLTFLYYAWLVFGRRD